jgi:hypothetical protein
MRPLRIHFRISDADLRGPTCNVSSAKRKTAWTRLPTYSKGLTARSGTS